MKAVKNSSEAHGARVLLMIDEMAAITAGGTERQILQIASIARKVGLEPEVCVLRGTKWLTPEIAGGPVTLFDIPSIGSLEGMRSLAKLTRWVRLRRFRIVMSFFCESNLLAPWIAKAAGIPVVLSTRRNLSHKMTDGPGAVLKMQWLSDLLVKEILANSQAVLEATARNEAFSRGKIRVIYNGIDVASLRPPAGAREAVRRQFGIQDEEVLIGNISGLREVKGVKLFARAAAIAAKKNSKLRFLMVGDGELWDEMQALVADNQLAGIFHMPGAAEDIRPYLAALDAAVLCSHAEGFSNSLLEYMAAGLPCIATDVGGNREALRDAGIVIAPGDSDALSQAMLAVADSGLRSRLGPAALNEVQRFTLCEAEKNLGGLLLEYAGLAPRNVLRPTAISNGEVTASFPGIGEQIAQRIASHPEALVEHNDAHISHGELLDRSRRLAGYLASLGAKPGERIAIYQWNSPELLQSVLAVLLTGAAYVPMDPSHPEARTRALLEDADVRLVLTCRELAAEVPAQYRAVLLDEDAWQKSDPLQGPAPVTPRTPAYVIFTSGSTGRPKGVEVNQQGVLNLLDSMERAFVSGPKQRVLSLTTFSFDMAQPELLLPLWSGADVVMLTRRGALDTRSLKATISEKKITLMQATPLMWGHLLQEGFESRPGMKLLCGGEAWSRTLADKLLAGGGQLWNVYGPTETTVWSSCAEVLPRNGPIPLGAPLQNTFLYLLDEAGALLSGPGTGELAIGGDGVANGYFRNSQQSAERFVPDPFRGGETRMFRTGDFVRRDENGELYFVGRKDNQVKVRGYRIELGDVEHAVYSVPGVRECAVVLRQNTRGESRLVCYVAPDSLTAQDLRVQVSDLLPAYMVPSLFVCMDALPHTTSHKIDRNSLPAPDWDALAPPRSSPEIAEPSSSLLDVGTMAAVWREVFPEFEITPQSDFFDLGGHSIEFAELQTLVSEKFALELTPEEILAAPTLEALTAHLAGRIHKPSPNVITIQPCGTQPPLFIVSQSLIFRQVAAHLGSDQPVFTIHVSDEDAAALGPNASFEQITSLYTAHILRANPIGPYRIGGWCVAGWLAFEMARQLQAAGKHVELLVLIDAWAPAYWRDMTPMRRMLAKQSYYASRTLLHASHLPRHGKWQFVRERFRGWLRNSPVDSLPDDATELDMLVDRAAATYKPGKYKGGAIVFRSEEQPGGLFLDKDMGWGKLLTMEPQVVTLPGDHKRIFSSPGAEQLASAIRSAL